VLIGSILGAIIGIVMATLVSGIIICLVGKLGLGIGVSGFGAAFITAFCIALLWAFASWLWSVIGYTPARGLSGAITPDAYLCLPLCHPGFGVGTHGQGLEGLDHRRGRHCRHRLACEPCAIRRRVCLNGGGV
jgi:hypothetical protein